MKVWKGLIGRREIPTHLTYVVTGLGVGIEDFKFIKDIDTL